MAIYAKNIRFLKEAIFAKLNNDSTLQTLLTGANRIFHQQPPSKVIYPCIVYNIINDIDNIFDETLDGGQVTGTFLRITIFSKNSTTEQSDNIEARIKELLNGQRTLDTVKIICYSCFRDNLLESIKDPDLLIWTTPIRYKIQWANK